MFKPVCVLNVYLGLCFMMALGVSDGLAEDSAFKSFQSNTKSSNQLLQRAAENYLDIRDKLFQQLDVIAGDEETRYIIVPGDSIIMSYLDRGTKNEAIYKVSDQGTIYVPLAGPVTVQGLNRRDARNRVELALKEYIREPKVDMSVNTVGNYMVVGEGGPGVFTLTPNMHLMEAILAAGYNEKKAKLNSIIVMRGGRDNPVVQRLDLKKMIKQGDRSDDILVKPGDLIYVPETYIASLDNFRENVTKWVSFYYTLGYDNIYRQRD
jgi:protein involved in polysaccharide export with SLBB domain